MKRQLALIPAALLLAATLTSCSTSDAPEASADCVAPGSVSDSITVSGDFGERIELTSDTPIEATETERSVLIEGDGDALVEGENSFVVLSVFDGRDGSLVERSRTPLNTTDTYAQWVRDTLNSGVVSDRVVTVVPANKINGFDSAGEGDSVVIVSDIQGPALEQAEGEEVSLPDTAPEEAIADNGEPTITVPEGLEAPSSLQVHTMVKGEGQEIQPGDEVFVHYKGIIWRTGEEFDSSWSRGQYINFNAASDQEAAELGIPGVIRGFRDALVGQTVGSRVMSVVPAEDGGYGGDALKGMGHEEDDVMVFVLDILEVVPLDSLDN